MNRKFSARLMVGACALLVALAACQTTASPYMPLRGGTVGYSEIWTQPNERFVVTYTGPNAMDAETVQRFMLYRAAEIALAGGYDRVTVRQAELNEVSLREDTSEQLERRVSYTYAHNLYGAIATYEPYRSMPVTRETTHFTASAEVAVGEAGEEAGQPTFMVADVVQLMRDEFTGDKP